MPDVLFAVRVHCVPVGVSACRLVVGGGVMRPNYPKPYQEFAVRLALRRFHARYSCPCYDRREWLVECEAVAWEAVLCADMPEACDEASVLPEMSAAKESEPVHGHKVAGEPLLEADWQRVLGLARQAENALKRFWRQEARFYSHCDALMIQNEEGEWVEREIEDGEALETLEAVLEQAFCEAFLSQLYEQLNATERRILQGLACGETQAAIGRALGMSQPAIHKHLRQIRLKAQAILGEIGENEA